MGYIQGKKQGRYYTVPAESAAAYINRYKQAKKRRYYKRYRPVPSRYYDCHSYEKCLYSCYDSMTCEGCDKYKQMTVDDKINMWSEMHKPDAGNHDLWQHPKQ